MAVHNSVRLGWLGTELHFKDHGMVADGSLAAGLGLRDKVLKSKY